MAMIDGVFCMGHACDRQMWDLFQLSGFTGLLGS